MSVGGAGRLEFVLGDIAQTSCEAIVNPTNGGFLLGHAGVNGALAAAAGPEYAAEADGLPERAAGADVLVTGAGRLPARYVIHAVSPIWTSSADTPAAALRRLHERVLATASELGCTSVALPAVGCGAHRFPPEVAASIAVPTVEAVLECERRLERVEFVFQNRLLLHDYSLRGRGARSDRGAIEILRSEIVNALSGGEPGLADQVSAIDDEPTLRAIDAEVHELARSLGAEDSASLSVSALYTRAVQHTLRPRPECAPGTG
jgi:O-acetyl-ADP-ribose deacetylase